MTVISVRNSFSVNILKIALLHLASSLYFFALKPEFMQQEQYLFKNIMFHKFKK
jgi:hypothetical protein